MSESELHAQLERQASRIRRAEEDLKTASALTGLVDRDMPVMLAYVDADECYRYHNRAFRRWLGLNPQQINGHTMREVLGEDVYRGIADRVRETLSGAAVHYERLHDAPNGKAMRVLVHFVPRLNEQRAVVGFYALVVDHTERRTAEETAPQRPAETESSQSIVPLGPAEMAQGVQELYEGAASQAQAAWKDAAARVKAAIGNNEFQLYGQAIKDLTADAPPFYGIFVRQAEEERNLMPPGAFFALAEKYGLMSELDRWVVSGVLQWTSERQRTRPQWRPSMYFINLSRDTISDPYFPEFVQDQVTQSGVPAEVLCFELQETDVLALRADTAEMVQNLRSAGSRIVLGGFGRDKVSFDILKEIHFDFLKLDGSVILNILRNGASLAKLRSVIRVAHVVGINTIAELVESGGIIAKLRELGVDYAQGFAISAASPLSELG